MMAIKLTVYVQPGAKKTTIAGMHGEHLKISLNAPPVDGAANQALIKFIAECLAIKMKDIQLIRGEKSRIKTLELTSSKLDDKNTDSLLSMLIQKKPSSP